jgi:hypothetical protein
MEKDPGKGWDSYVYTILYIIYIYTIIYYIYRYI